MLAIREASNKLKNWRLNDCSMYVTLEPCSMCASLIAQSRIKKVVVGLRELNSGSFGSVISFNEFNLLNYQINVTWDIREDSIILLEKFFAGRRIDGN